MGKGAKAAVQPENDAGIEGDDHIEIFDKHVERLMSIAEQAEFESGTLVGDIRDTMLDVFKNRPKPWSQLSEAEQRDLAKALDNVAKTFIRKVVRVVAEEDLFSIDGVIKGYSGKGGAFKVNIEARGDEQTATELFKMDGHDVVIMSADASRFTGQKKDAEVQPDQPAFGFADPPAGAEGDEDLVEAAEAGEAVAEAEIEVAEAEAQPAE